MGDESLLASLARAGEPPTVTTPTLDGPWPPATNLAALAGSDAYIARVQGLLLSLGYGPHGLVASASGLPDGIYGPKTGDAIRQFKRAHGLADDARVDDQTWWYLVNTGLR